MNLKKLVLSATIAIGASVAGGYAIAATYYTDIEYYSDVGRTQVVGEVIRTCRGQTQAWGVITAYKRTVESYNCAYPIP